MIFLEITNWESVHWLRPNNSTGKPGHNEVNKNWKFFVTCRFSLHTGFELMLTGMK